MQLLDGRTYAFQWDRDIYVILPKAKAGETIHFAHRKDKKALVVTAKEVNSIIVAGVPKNIYSNHKFRVNKASFIYVSYKLILTSKSLATK